MTVHFIISVGTSIIGNYENKKNTLLNPIRIKNVTTPLPKPAELCANFSNIKNMLEKRKLWGAERSSVEKVISEKQLDRSNCRFHLISTNTPKCIFCASYLGHEIFGISQTKFTCRRV